MNHFIKNLKLSFVILLILPMVSCTDSRKVVKKSDQIVAPFDGRKFDNIEPFPDAALFDVVVWQVTSLFTRKPWPQKVEQNFFKPKSERSQTLQVAVVNHATVLIQMDGVNLLTDPQFSERASPLSWAGPKRVIQPGIAFEDLPPIDAVLISHDHYDHLDLPSLKKISKRWSSKIYVGLGNKALLDEHKIKNVIEMDWWDRLEFKNIEIQFVPVQHWSARGAGDRRETLWGGYVVHGSAKRVFFAGDTGYGKVFKMIKERVGSMDLSLIPIGAYEPRDFMKNAHVWPVESVRIFKDTESESAIGIHFGTFADLTNEYIDEPPKDLRKALLEQEVPEGRFVVPEFGRTYTY